MNQRTQKALAWLLLAAFLCSALTLGGSLVLLHSTPQPEATHKDDSTWEPSEEDHTPKSQTSWWDNLFGSPGGSASEEGSSKNGGGETSWWEHIFGSAQGSESKDQRESTSWWQQSSGSSNQSSSESEESEKGTLVIRGGLPGSTATVLVIDTSGSMDEDDLSGRRKIEGAVEAAKDLIALLRHENQWNGQPIHTAGVVSFDGDPVVEIEPTADFDEVEEVLDDLWADGGTAMAAALQEATQTLLDIPAEQRVMVLLTDGVPTIGTDGTKMARGDYDPEVYERLRQQVLAAAHAAAQQGICIYAVGFGDPNQHESDGSPSLDIDLLRQVATTSTCGAGPGAAYNSQTAFQLRTVFVQTRHASQGEVLSQNSGQIQQGAIVDLGTVEIPKGQTYFRYTLLWPTDEGEVEPVLVDPQGRQVDAHYPQLDVYRESGLTDLIIHNPLPGSWRLGVYGKDVPNETLPYSEAASIHPGAPQATLPTTWLVGLGCLGGLALLGMAGMVVMLARRSTKHAFRPPPPPPIPAGIQAPAVLLTPTGQAIPLNGTDFLLGRSASCTIRFADRTVSRYHARLQYLQGAWMLEDLGSKGGTWVNGRRIQSRALRSGDWIRLGDQVLYFYLLSSPKMD